MINEYALEPSLLNTWHRFRYLSEKFGYCRGRVISRYPKHWERMVYDSLSECGPVEKKRIEEGLRRLKPAIHSRFHEWFDLPWLENALIENGKRPFHAIIAPANPNNLACVICEDGLDEATQPRWQASVQQHVQRDAASLAKCAELLLNSAREIIFVDPHFSPAARRFTCRLEEFLEAIANRHPSASVTRIEYHTGDTSGGIKSFFDHECQLRLPRIIPHSMQIRFVRWDQASLHNRFILTERGGLKFATGLDEQDGSSPAQDIVDLLAEGPYATTWKQYQRLTPVFPLREDDLIITGLKR